MAICSIIIPAYNEEQAIPSVLSELQQLPLDAEIIVIDDASTDTTVQAAQRMNVQVIQREKNEGTGKSIKDGIEAATTDIIVLIDADGTYPVSSIPTLVQKLDTCTDMVVGARTGKEYRGSTAKLFARIALRYICEWVTHTHIPDVNSGLRVLRKSTVTPFLPLLCDSFSFMTTITIVYMMQEKHCVYIPIEYFKRIGTSKVRIVRDSIKTFWYIVECTLQLRPLRIFSLLSVASIVLGIVFMPLQGFSAFTAGIFTSIVLFSIGLLSKRTTRTL